MQRTFNIQDPINQLALQIVACATQVHNTLGSGFAEDIYRKALAIELAKAGLRFTSGEEVDVYYDNKSIGSGKVDFMVDGAIMLHIMVVAQLQPRHSQHAQRYCDACHIFHGLLLNFGEPELEFCRVKNSMLPVRG